MSNIKSDKVSTAENFSEYLHVNILRPWFILLILLALIVGACVWACFKYLDTSISTLAVMENNELTFYLKVENKDELEDAVLIIGEDTYAVNSEMLADEPLRADYGFSDWMLSQAGFVRGEWIYPVSMTITDIPNGVYSARLVVERRSLLSIILDLG